MAGRYDSNPFEEDDVNPFSVRAPDPPPPLVAAIPPLLGRRSSFLYPAPCFFRVLATSVLLGSRRGADLTTAPAILFIFLETLPPPTLFGEFVPL